MPPFPLDQEDVLRINETPMRNPTNYLTITSAVSLTGFPVLSLPCGFTQERLPVGLQVIGPPKSEARLLAFADLREQQLGFKHHFPKAYP